MRKMSSKKNELKNRIYHQGEFKSFDHFIDFASEMMVTRADVEQILCQTSEELLPFLRTIEKKLLVEAFFHFSDEEILKLQNTFSPDDRIVLKKAWLAAKEPTAETQWAAQKTLSVLFQRYLQHQMK